ncbi:[protein-PII] uridylyltransferase [Succinimonas amylolytica]|uniref:[protein-PII] uridylyltransferase n=1 Tax=Succinimonas amylolytica TaxID=83769 RepID=UPI000375A2DC|nr:[protein-PII] uridylyltransferase [Succinimonas amylolytica]
MQNAAAFLPSDAITMENGRAAIKQQIRCMAELFSGGSPVNELVQFRTAFTDLLLKKIWSQFQLVDFPELALVAVGGYGRGDLQPHSDIDILIVSPDSIPEEVNSCISSMTGLLWDLKLDLGLSVRTIAECISEGRKDVTIATNLMETRLITGNRDTYDKLIGATREPDFWTPQDFFLAKIEEQNNRYHYYKDTVYMLEPDLKNNPGCLRDIQTMLWISEKALGIKSIRELQSRKLLSRIECYELTDCQDFLWRIRFALHLTISKPDNRLTFDRQRAIAENLGYTGEGNAPVERLMKRFYQTTHTVHELNKIVTQLIRMKLFSEELPKKTVHCQPFIFRGSLIDVLDHNIFIKKPEIILELFITLTERKELTGIYVECIRSLREARRHLGSRLSEKKECRELFKKLIANPRSLKVAFPLMHEHHILGMFIPRWNAIRGLMQFDMFHQYTVDGHTIRVLENIYWFAFGNDPRFTLFRQIYNEIDKPELLFLAALFHDIGKGRGGHHAAMGAPDALYFAKLLGYNRFESKLVSWIVRMHLYMSIVAQRRDISDPEVVADFAREVGDETFLNYLYCMTVADINATNDNEWNSYKDSLFRTLYFSARDAMRKGLENPPDLNLHIRENQKRALGPLVKIGLSPASVFKIWNNFRPEYFIKYQPEQISWHTSNIIAHRNEADLPLILFAQNHNTRCTELFIYTRDTDGIFAKVCAVLGSKKLNIMAATISNTNENYALDTFSFTQNDGTPLPADRMSSLRKSLTGALMSDNYRAPAIAMRSERLDLFRIPTLVSFLKNREHRTSELEISTLDVPGILARISSVFQKHRLSLHAAKITTTGERADDFFSLTNTDGSMLSEQQKSEIEKDITDILAHC